MSVRRTSFAHAVNHFLKEFSLGVYFSRGVGGGGMGGNFSRAYRQRNKEKKKKEKRKRKTFFLLLSLAHTEKHSKPSRVRI